LGLGEEEIPGVGEDADIGAPPAQADNISAERMATAQVPFMIQ